MTINSDLISTVAMVAWLKGGGQRLQNNSRWYSPRNITRLNHTSQATDGVAKSLVITCLFMILIGRWDDV